MKTFILALLSTILFSCGDGELLITRTHKPDCNNIASNGPCINYYVVSKIENRQDSLCRYYLTTSNYNWLLFDSNISFVDSIGKFEIGERLYVSFDKIK
jgi:hypothetical protein